MYKKYHYLYDYIDLNKKNKFIRYELLIMQ